MLLVVPKGRGNCKPTTLQIDGPRLSAITLRPGQVFELGGVTWRIVSVLP